MNRANRSLLAGCIFLLLASSVNVHAEEPAKGFSVSAAVASGKGKYCRFQKGDHKAYGLLYEDSIREIEGDLFGVWKFGSDLHRLADVKLLVPVERPSKVIALAGNYKDHLGDKPAPEFPEPFFKLPSCLIATGENIIQPSMTEPVHYEAELVIVIGSRTKNVSEADALSHVMGITCGNDISARVWQKGDVQWWRAKGSDTFGPVVPYIASGFDYGKLNMELRVNGEVKQKTNTANMIHSIAQTVGYVSRHITLEPGDLIFTGTPGKTEGMKPGDVVEVEIEGVGILRNKLVAEGE